MIARLLIRKSVVVVLLVAAGGVAGTGEKRLGNWFWLFIPLAIAGGHLFGRWFEPRRRPF